MKTFQYQVLRYLPDRVSGEFINLGVVIYLPEEKELKALFYTKSNRLHSFFPTVNTRHIIKSIRAIDVYLKRLNEDFKKPLFANLPASLEELTKKILPKDDSALFFTETLKILDVNSNSLLSDLYERHVAKYVHEADHDTLADKEVWKQYYKSYFDKYKITEKLRPGTVTTKMDTWKFERTFKNGALHCFESVSFDLSSDEYIRKKVYTWAGRVDELKTAKDQIHLYLLAALPDKTVLKKFIQDKLGKVKLDNAIIEIVDTKSAEKIVKNIKKKIEDHS